jgi:hypothetical protein
VLIRYLANPQALTLIQCGGRVLNGYAQSVVLSLLRSLRILYHRLPLTLRMGVRAWINRVSRATGILYVWEYLRYYKRIHQLHHFAGNIPLIKEEYRKSTRQDQLVLAEQFRSIIKFLVMRNGVTKITLAGRHNKILETVLRDDRFRVKQPAVKVLDVPSSVGLSSLDAWDLLTKYYMISSYVLGDLFFTILYDMERGCIFDDNGYLLQVRFKTQFVNIYQPYTSGSEYTALSYLLMLPFRIRSWYLKRKYKFNPYNNYKRILLTHPEIDRKLNADNGQFHIKKMDALEPIDEKFDIILSFNLLIRDYFPEGIRKRGIRNLGHALKEGGLLVVGNDDTFTGLRKINGSLTTIGQCGDF